MGKKMETGTDSIFWGSKILVDSHCSREIKRSLNQKREFEQTPGDGEGQEAWSAAVHRVAESDMTEPPNDSQAAFSCAPLA